MPPIQSMWYTAEQLKTLEQPLAVALGVFDGIHRGHAAVLRQTAAFAAEGLLPVACLPRPYPQPYLTGQPPQRLLTDTLQAKYFREAGIQGILPMDFSAIKNWAPETFVERMLAGELRAKALCCGFNFRFGKDAVGTTADLSRIAKNHGMVVRVANPIDYDGQAISSTRIREALQQGDMVSADAMLGRPFSFDFPVVSGDRRGRLLGAPTLNQPFPEDYMLPRFGVYASLAFVEGRWHTAVTNLGIRPTVQSPIPLAETCILNYKGDLYGQRVEVALIRFIRPEKKFDSFEALSKAIHEDAQTATQMIKEDGRFGAFHTGHTV